MNKPLIYISGPITGIMNHKESFTDCENWIKEENIYIPVNPAKEVINKLINHYNIKVPTYNDFMLCALICMMQNNCKDIILLPHWQYSKGACIELLYAKYFKYNVHLYYPNIKHGSRRLKLK